MFTSTSVLWYYSCFSKYYFLIPSATFLPSSNCSFNSIISSLFPFSYSSNIWSISSFRLFDFSIYDLKEIISTSSPSQYCLDYTATFTDLTWSLLIYASSLSLRSLIFLEEKSSFLLILRISSNLSYSESIIPSDITYSPFDTRLLVSSPYEKYSFVFPSWIPNRSSHTYQWYNT